MIELRWVKFKASRKNQSGTEYEYIDKKLQYRYQTFLEFGVGLWSQWQDVPNVTAEEIVEAS